MNFLLAAAAAEKAIQMRYCHFRARASIPHFQKRVGVRFFFKGGTKKRRPLERTLYILSMDRIVFFRLRVSLLETLVLPCNLALPSKLRLQKKFFEWVVGRGRKGKTIGPKIEMK